MLAQAHRCDCFTQTPAIKPTDRHTTQPPKQSKRKSLRMGRHFQTEASCTRPGSNTRRSLRFEGAPTVSQAGHWVRSKHLGADCPHCGHKGKCNIASSMARHAVAPMAPTLRMTTRRSTSTSAKGPSAQLAEDAMNNKPALSRLVWDPNRLTLHSRCKRQKLQSNDQTYSAMVHQFIVLARPRHRLSWSCIPIWNL